MLNTWEGAIKFAGGGLQKIQPIKLARLLGWTEVKRDSTQMNDIARACSNAYTLIDNGHLQREDFEGLAIGSVRNIVSKTLKK